MILTDEEKRMLGGELGYPCQKAMEIIVSLGKIYGAERLIPVSNVHMPGSSIVVSGSAGLKFIEKMRNSNGCFRAMTTLNTAAVDFNQWKELGFEEDIFNSQRKLTSAYCGMGAFPCHTCSPYLIGNLPRFGEHIAWGESSAVAYVNSVIGARSNREGGPSALASALVGRVAAFGYHLTENRRGTTRVDVNTGLSSISDFGALGYYVGKIVEDGVPVFHGIPENATSDMLKMLGAALASSGSVALFHVIGSTPEALDEKSVYQGKAPESELVFGKKELESSRNDLTKAHGEKAGLVAIGCPHSSITEIEKIASLIEGKKIKSDVDFWVMTSTVIREYAERCGYRKIIEEAGGLIVTDTCPVLAAMTSVQKQLHNPALVTNSAKLAHYAPGQWGFPVYFRDLTGCVEAAVEGVLN